MLSYKNKLILILLPFFFGTPGSCIAEEDSVLELGLGIGGLNIPHYRGSDQETQFIVPIPYVKYTSKRLKVDREGGRYILYDFGETKLDISMDFSFPVDSDDNVARQDMPDLNPIVEIGPRFVFYPYTSENKSVRLRFALPLRMAIATTLVENDFIGLTFSPYMQLRFHNYLETAVTIGPYWATEKYHDNFYQVDSEYSTAQRSIYDAKGGYGGSRISLTMSKRFKKYWIGLVARYDLLNGAVYEDSPLVKQKTAFMFGLAFAYVFKRSNM